MGCFVLVAPNVESNEFIVRDCSDSCGCHGNAAVGFCQLTTKLTCPVLPGRGNRFYQKPRPAAPGQVERLVRWTNGHFFSDTLGRLTSGRVSNTLRKLRSTQSFPSCFRLDFWSKKSPLHLHTPAMLILQQPWSRAPARQARLA